MQLRRRSVFIPSLPPSTNIHSSGCGHNRRPNIDWCEDRKTDIIRTNVMGHSTLPTRSERGIRIFMISLYFKLGQSPNPKSCGDSLHTSHRQPHTHCVARGMGQSQSAERGEFQLIFDFRFDRPKCDNRHAKRNRIQQH